MDHASLKKNLNITYEFDSTVIYVHTTEITFIKVIDSFSAENIRNYTTPVKQKGNAHSLD